MRYCKKIGCATLLEGNHDFCPACQDRPSQYREGGSAPFHEPVQKSHPRPQADDLLRCAAGHMEDRATTYDAPGGERSMGKTVAAFNALTGQHLSETEGWTFMALLKIARANQGGFKRDNYEDLIAYTALAGEAALREHEEA